MAFRYADTLARQQQRLSPFLSPTGAINGPSRQLHSPSPWRSGTPSTPAPNAPQAPAPSGGSGDGGRFGWDAKATFDKYTSQIDYSASDALDQLERAMRAGGVDFERRTDGAGDLFRIAGTDAGWVDILQNKAAVEGRGPVRGWAYQPFYGREDFDRLVGLGRNPHTGEMAPPGAQYSRESDQPIGSGFASSAMGGAGLAAAMAGRRPRSAPNPMAGRQGTISAGMNAAAPSTRRAVAGAPSPTSSTMAAASAMPSSQTRRRRSGSGSYRIAGVITSPTFKVPHPLGEIRR